MRKSIVVLAWLACLLVRSFTLGYGQTTSAEGAAAKATAFATAQDIPWGEATETTLRENANPARKAEWVVNFGSFASIGVDRRTGAVLSVVDYSAVTAHAAAKAPAKLDQAAAIARANEIITRAGLSTAAQLGAPEVLLQEADPGAWRFAVKYPCQYQGIPYQYGGATVLLAAEDGKLLALSAAIDVLTPASTAVTVDEDTAKESALGHASKLALSAAGTATASAKVMIVVPNSYWNRWGQGAKEDETVARTAWVVTVKRGGAELIFWIDAADGRLLGGTQSRGAVAYPASDAATTRASGEVDRGAWFRLLGAAILAASLLLAGAALVLSRRQARRSAV